MATEVKDAVNQVQYNSGDVCTVNNEEMEQSELCNKTQSANFSQNTENNATSSSSSSLRKCPKPG